MSQSLVLNEGTKIIDLGVGDIIVGLGRILGITRKSEGILLVSFANGRHHLLSASCPVAAYVQGESN